LVLVSCVLAPSFSAMNGRRLRKIITTALCIGLLLLCCQRVFHFLDRHRENELLIADLSSRILQQRQLGEVTMTHLQQWEEQAAELATLRTQVLALVSMNPGLNFPQDLLDPPPSSPLDATRIEDLGPAKLLLLKEIQEIVTVLDATQAATTHEFSSARRQEKEAHSRTWIGFLWPSTFHSPPGPLEEHLGLALRMLSGRVRGLRSTLVLENTVRDINDQLGVEAQRRFRALQFPSDCAGAKFLHCRLNKACGFGCEIHNVIFCFAMAYGSNRTMVLHSGNWAYSKNGWTGL